MKTGLNYLLYEERADTSFKMLEKLVKDHPVLCITTIYPKKVENLYNLTDAAIIWLTDSEGGEGTVRPERLDFELSRGVTNFISENDNAVVMFEGCEYLLLENDFKSVKKFFKRVNDHGSMNGATMIVSVNPAAFDSETIAALSKDFDLSGEPDKFLEIKSEQPPKKEAPVEINHDKTEAPGVEDIDELFQKASTHMKKRQYRRAVDTYDSIIKNEPTNTKALFNKAVSLQMSNRLNESVQAYDELLELNPNDIDSLINKGLALRKLGRMDEAVSAYRKAGEINPYDSTVWNNLGIALKNMGRLAEAIETYDKGLEARPDDAGLWNNKGVALKEAGKAQEALECYNKALSIDPSRENTRRNKMLLEKEIGH